MYVCLFFNNMCGRREWKKKGDKIELADKVNHACYGAL